MTLETLKNIGWTALLLLVQVLVLNHIHLFNCITPLLYVYVALLFRRNYPRWGILVWCFLTGLTTDIFTNTPGVAAASMTLAGLLQPYLLELFVRHDEDQTLSPSMKEMGPGKFLWYAIILVFIYCFCFFTLEMFTHFDGVLWISSIAGSFALTFILILVLENLRRP